MNLMDNIFASITSGVITANDTNIVTLCNRAAEVIIGIKSQQVIGRNLEDILPLAADVIPQMAQMRDRGKSIVDLEISHVLPDGGSVDWRLNMSPPEKCKQTSSVN